ncbi:MAG: ATP-dependent DNA ligase [Rickettsiales bacterium]|nr:ATP-dependent DNA ligase [Rickettsiales bacterium]MAI83693.1 ATP-dependent DNA ligase [Rickettsiales bacterium]|tara:strand:- start:12132 stop:13412 length:1281 start_codon:yes stop_codon:yes gene_type:complete
MHKIIQELETDNSRLKKEAIIRRESDADNIEFFNGVGMALDGFRTFGLKQVPKATKDGPGLSWERFAYVVDKLEKRELTGNDMRKTVDHLCETAKVEQWNDWYRRILIKDLRCGVTHKTINKHSKIKVPVFECMLADDSKKHEKKMTGEVLVEPKLDGVRVVVICDVDKDEVKLFSRNGKELSNFPKILQQFDEMLDQMPESMVFDGEVMSDDFQTLMREIHRKGGAKTDDAILNVFDCLPLEDFKEGACSTTLIDRKKILDNYQFGSNIRLVENVKINLSEEDGQKQFADYNKLCIDKGYEGIMVKPVNGIYECKRSSLWLKVKPFIEVSLTVKDVEEGTGRNVGKLGALIVEGKDDGKFIKTNVGSGLTDTDRETFWKAKDKLIGQIVEVRADQITQNQDSKDEWSLRFPRFLRFRGFEIGEKL